MPGPSFGSDGTPRRSKSGATKKGVISRHLRTTALASLCHQKEDRHKFASGRAEETVARHGCGPRKHTLFGLAAAERRTHPLSSSARKGAACSRCSRGVRGTRGELSAVALQRGLRRPIWRETIRQGRITGDCYGRTRLSRAHYAVGHCRFFSSIVIFMDEQDRKSVV